jgi:hypothetical protein
VTTPDPRPPTLDSDRGAFLRLLVAAIARRAARAGTFTVFDVAKESALPEPHHANWWGIGAGIAHREGLIVAVDAVQSKRPKTAKSLVRLWIGARFAEKDEAA